MGGGIVSVILIDFQGTLRACYYSSLFVTNSSGEGAGGESSKPVQREGTEHMNSFILD